MEVKTVVIVNDFNYTQGGASKVAIDTARILKEENIKVIFFSAVNKEKEKINGVEYVSTNQNEALKEKNKIKGAINGIYNLKAKKDFKRLLNKLDRDTTIIHVHGWTKALSSSIFDVAFKMKFKVVLTLHDYFTACPNGGYFNYKQNTICHLKPLSWKCIKCNCDSRNYGFKLYRVLRQFVQNKIIKLNDKLENVITISEFSEKILKSTLGKNTKITRIYNPIEIGEKIEKIDSNQNQYYLYVGRISKEKGVDLFCQAITELKLKGIAVGDGDEKEKLSKQYPNIEFTGWKNKDEVKEYMKKAKALIFPSRWYETAGLTVLEAQSLGIPTLVSSNSAGSEFVNEKEWIFKNLDELKKKIVNLEPRNVKVISKEYSITSYLNKITALYNNINFKKIENLKEIKKQLREEKNIYYDKDILKRIFHIIVGQPDIRLYKIMKDAKIYRFYKENKKSNILWKIKCIYFARKVNRNSKRYSVEIFGKFGKNLLLCHAPIIINGYSSIGDNCILHGMNCIGAKHHMDDAPTIGNNVEIGVGAVIIREYYNS